MFDAHICYYAYKNIVGDDFGVGYYGNKAQWISILNGWNRNEERDYRYVVEQWDDLDCELDFRGLVMAEVEPDGQAYLVTWFDDKEQENVMQITPERKIVWVTNPEGIVSVPRWVSQLKNKIVYDES